MAKRDIPREHIGELVEELLIEARDRGDIYLEGAKINLEADGLVKVLLKRGTKYSVRVIQHGR